MTDLERVREALHYYGETIPNDPDTMDEADAFIDAHLKEDAERDEKNAEMVELLKDYRLVTVRLRSTLEGTEEEYQREAERWEAELTRLRERKGWVVETEYRRVLAERDRLREENEDADRRERLLIAVNNDLTTQRDTLLAALRNVIAQYGTDDMGWQRARAVIAKVTDDRPVTSMSAIKNGVAGRWVWYPNGALPAEVEGEKT